MRYGIPKASHYCGVAVVIVFDWEGTIKMAMSQLVVEANAVI